MSLNRWIIILILIPHFEIYYLGLSGISSITSVLRVVVVVLAIVILMREMNKFNLITGLFLAVIFFSSIFNRNLTLGTGYRLVILFSLTVFLLYLIKYNFKELIIGLYYLLTALVLLNFLSVLAGGLGYSSTGSTEYLLGRKNHLIFSIIPYITIAYIYSHKRYNQLKVFPLLSIFISLLSVILAGSGTGIIISIVFIIFLLFPKIVYPSFYKYIYLYIFLFISIVLYRVQEKWFGDLIVNFLEKDVSLSGRTLLWDISIESIKNNWLIGVGRGNTVIEDVYWYLNESHNGLLEVALDGGIIAVILFVLALFSIAKQLKQHKNNNIVNIISLSLFLFLINGLSESLFLMREFWILMVFGYGIRYIIKFNYIAEQNMLIKEDS